MATAVGSAGTNSTTTFLNSALQFYANNPGLTGVNPADNQFSADVGTINNLIRDDRAYVFPAFTGQAGSQVIPALTLPLSQATAGLLSGGLSHAGVLHIPNRGMLKVLPGDVVVIGATGWPMLLSRVEAVYGAANAKWTFSVAVN